MNFRTAERQDAFTLLEIIVAIAIFGLIVAAIFSSWMAIVRGAETGQRAAAAVQRSRIAVSTLEDALMSARSFAVDIEYYGFVAQNGNDAMLSFVAKLPPSFPRSGRFGDFDVRRLTFSLEAGRDSGNELVLRQSPLLMDMDIDEKEHPLVLAKDLKAFEMEFWDVRSSDWLDEWTRTNQLPPLVRITLKFDRKAGGSVQPEKEIIREIALPAITVQPGWQRPGAPPAAGPIRAPGLLR